MGASPAHGARTPAVLGVDVGTSGSKGILVALDGTVVATAVREHTVDRPAPGHVQMDGEQWWRELVALTAELTAAAPEVEVTGIGVSGMGPCVLLTEADGTPVRPAILYGVDTRAGAQIARLQEELDEDEILERCGCVLTAQAAGPKIAWVAEHEPEAYARAERLFMPASYLAFRLTGAYVLDHASASQVAPLYDLAAGAWHTPWAEAVAPGLPLPALRWSGEAAGTLTAEAAAQLPGVHAGVPVTTGTIDAWAEAVGAGISRPGDLMLMYGTTTFLVALTERALPGRELWATAGVHPGASTLAGGMAASGAITGWLRELTAADGFGDLVAEAAESGAAVRHHPAAMAAAGARIDRVVAVGGGAQQDLWPQIVSDVTGLPQQIPVLTIGACYGGAMLAAQLAHGTDVAAWQRTDHEVTPDPAVRADYDELYALYRELYPATCTVSHALAARQRRG